MDAGKWFAGIGMAGLAASFFMPLGGWEAYAQRLFVGIVAVHVLQLALFWPRMRAAGGSIGAQVAHVMVFGMFHVRTLPKPVRD